MRACLCCSPPCSLAAPAAAQRAPEWRTAPEADVLLRPFAYEPRIIRLRAGEPVKLRFVNEGRATLGFSRAGLLRRRPNPPARPAGCCAAAAFASPRANGSPSPWSRRRAATARAAATSPTESSG